MRFLIPTILVGISIASFFMFVSPSYNEIVILREQIASYEEALNNSKALESERDKLSQKYNSFAPGNLSKLQKLLPDNVDNIRLILEIEKVATPYGMTLKDVRYETTKKDEKKGSTSVAIQGGIDAVVVNKDYGTWNLQFSTTGTYKNFLNFIKDLENNLRIVDISSIQFSSIAGNGLNISNNNSESYKYDITIKTYWLKN